MVDVSGTNKVFINVSNNQKRNNVNITNNTAMYYSELAKSYAKDANNALNSTVNEYIKILDVKADAIKSIEEEIALRREELKGDKGDKGDKGEQGIQGIQGEKGDTGIGGIWGSIEGNIENQLDLIAIWDGINNKLNEKINLQIATKVSFPSKRYINLSLGASGSTYVAPANGWFLFDKTATAGGEYVVLQVLKEGNVIIDREGSAPANYFHLNFMTPVSKGDVVSVVYQMGGATNYFRFIYAEGEV